MRASTLALLPLLAAQGLWVATRAQRLPEATGPREGTLGNGPPLRLLIVGDSSAAGVGAKTQSDALSGRLTTALAQSHRVTWKLIAKTGATTATTLDTLDKTAPWSADIALTVLGVNDTTRATSPKSWTTRQQALQSILKTKFGVRRQYHQGLPPMGDFPLLPNPLRRRLGQHATRLDTALQQLAQDTGTTHLALDLPLTTDDMAPDGFHPGPAIYAAWGEAVAKRILTDLETTPLFSGS